MTACTLGLDAKGRLPVGVQIVGAPGSGGTLMQVAREIERAFNVKQGCGL